MIGNVHHAAIAVARNGYGIAELDFTDRIGIVDHDIANAVFIDCQRHQGCTVAVDGKAVGNHRKVDNRDVINRSALDLQGMHCGDVVVCRRDIARKPNRQGQCRDTQRRTHGARHRIKPDDAAIMCLAKRVAVPIVAHVTPKSVLEFRLSAIPRRCSITCKMRPRSAAHIGDDSSETVRPIRWCYHL